MLHLFYYSWWAPFWIQIPLSKSCILHTLFFVEEMKYIGSVPLLSHFDKVHTFKVQKWSEPCSTDSLGHQHHAIKLSPKIAIHFKVLCESKAMLRSNYHIYFHHMTIWYGVPNISIHFPSMKNEIYPSGNLLSHHQLISPTMIDLTYIHHVEKLAYA